MPSTILADLMKWSKTLDFTDNTDPQNKMLVRELATRCDCPYLSGSILPGVIEIQTLASGSRTGGTFDLRMRQSKWEFDDVPNNPQVITDDLSWQSTASEIQIQVDITAPGTFPNYQDGDIVISGGVTGAGGSDIIWTWSGDSLHGHQATPGVGGTNLTGPTPNPAFTVDQQGSSAQPWFAALRAFGVITGTDPAFSDTPAGQYTVHSRDEMENYPSQQTIKALVMEASVQENEDWMTELLVPLNISF